MSWIVIATPTEGVGDFEVIGAFVDKDDAISWIQTAFYQPRYRNYVFRAKQMRDRGGIAPSED